MLAIPMMSCKPTPASCGHHQGSPPGADVRSPNLLELIQARNYQKFNELRHVAPVAVADIRVLDVGKR